MVLEISLIRVSNFEKACYILHDNGTWDLSKLNNAAITHANEVSNNIIGQKTSYFLFIFYQAKFPIPSHNSLNFVIGDDMHF